MPGTQEGSKPTRIPTKTNVSFREVPARAKMVVPEWLPAQKGDGIEVIYPLHLVNGTYQGPHQEVIREREL